MLAWAACAPGSYRSWRFPAHRRHELVEGRDKDMINRGGEKISAEEIENLVYRLPGIAQVAAVAMADAEFGERLCVFVVPRPGGGITIDSIRAGMAVAGVAKYKWPERLEIVTELPVTKVGKIDKKALRDRLSGRQHAGRRPE